ncbi:MAG: InlB B-repeat-containing protein, partial [Clostridia bacterium]|nr:InlB B-repeat-containing protein [Clostridia bacterium]
VYDGYRFAGWYTLPNGGELFDFNSDITENITLYARWEQVVYVHFDLNGAPGSISSQIIAYGAYPARPANPVWNGYVFLGWNTIFDGSGEYFDFATSPNYTVTLYAQWSREVSVMFDANGGSNAPSTQTVSAYNAMTYPDTTPTRSGYAFAGWYTSSYGGELFDFTVLPTSDITLYARWNSSYSNAYGTLAMNAVYDSIYAISHNTTARYYAFIAQKSGIAEIYTQGSFNTIGYLYDSNKYQLTSDNSSGDGNNFHITYNLQAGNVYYLRVCGAFSLSGYTKLIMCDGDRVNVFFDLNGSNEGSAPSTQSVARIGGIAEPTAPTRFGYTFGGWYTNADCVGNAYDLSKSPCYDITLYAKWNKNITVTFVDGLTTVTTQTLASGELLQYVQRSNYGSNLFAGWYDNPSCNGSPYDFSLSPTDNITLYA